MIDLVSKSRRYISEFCKKSDELIAEYELLSFDLNKFQAEFGVESLDNPMFDSYPITESNIEFLREYIKSEPVWDFWANEYFIDAEAL